MRVLEKRIRNVWITVRIVKEDSIYTFSTQVVTGTDYEATEVACSSALSSSLNFVWSFANLFLFSSLSDKGDGGCVGKLVLRIPLLARSSGDNSAPPW